MPIMCCIFTIQTLCQGVYKINMSWQSKLCVDNFHAQNRQPMRSRSSLMPQDCITYPITDPNYLAIEQSYRTCTSYPATTDGVTAKMDTKLPPFRTPLDQNAWGYMYNIVYGTRPQGPTLSTDCSVLNGTQWCPTVDGCQWKEFTVGLGNDDHENKNSDGDCSNLAKRMTYDNGIEPCFSTMSICVRTRADPTFKKSCCLGEFPLGISHSVNVNTGIALGPDIPIFNVPPQGGITYYANSVDLNAFDAACDPAWCFGSSQCDPVLYEECAFSVTTVGTSTVHAALAPSGLCRDWYLTYTQLGLYSTNSWVLIDDMINSYCLASASFYNDTISCACVDPRPNSIFYSSCTDFGQSCGGGLRRLAAVNVGTSDTIALSDYVCSNPYCLSANSGHTSFVTSGILERLATCPTQVCMQMIMDQTITIGEITGGSVYIRDTSLMCSDRTASTGAPIFQLFPANTVWFYDNVAKTITNPESIQFVAYQSTTPGTSYYSLSYAVPAWINAQSIYPGAIGVNTLTQFQFTIDPLKISSPTATTIEFTLIALTARPQDGGVPFSPPAQFTVPLTFAVVDVSVPQPPPPPPPKPGQNEGVLPLMIASMSPGTFALIVMSVTFVLFSIFLMLVNILTLK